jgi:hypothetical protein
MRAFQISAAVLAFLLFHGTGWTTTVLRIELPALVEQADTIVQGRVERLDAQWDERRKIIFTNIQIRVDEQLKGAAQPTVLVRQLGGKVGSLNMSISGMPAFRPGENVIVFLKRNPEPTYHVVGLSQGKYQIADDFATNNAAGLDLIDNKNGKVSAGGLVRRESLDSFKSRIRSLVK